MQDRVRRDLRDVVVYEGIPPGVRVGCDEGKAARRDPHADGVSWLEKVARRRDLDTNLLH